MFAVVYRLLTDLAAPFISVYMRRRLAEGREDEDRFAERFGHASRARPEGKLVWCHAASVGEAVSLLLLIDKLHDTHPDINILMTTGTVTSARLMASRLPSHAIHQYVPIDRAPCLKRFLNHWKPTMALWIESELWPNTLAALRKRAIPVVLLNARMSEKSFRHWSYLKGFARELMSSFVLCLAQTETDKARYVALGAAPVKCLGNLKYASAPLPFSPEDLTALRDQAKGRLVWLMASTHRGEEEKALAAHRALAAKTPTILTIIAPRHPVRGDEIAQKIKTAGLRCARRSKGEPITAETNIYLADTLGDMGLLYALCPVVVLGGSFVWVGGHNPIEPAQSGAAIIVGPHMYNFSEITKEFIAVQALTPLKREGEIAPAVERLLSDAAARDAQTQAAHRLANQKRYVLDQIVAEMEPFL